MNAREWTARHVELLRAERGALADLLLSLAEFDRLGAYRELGFATLFDYLHRELHLSRGSAHYRQVATRLVARFPEVVEPIRDGRLCLSTVIVVARVMTEANRFEVLPRFFGLSRQEAEQLAVEIRPVEVVPRRTVVTEVPVSKPSVLPVVAPESSPENVEDHSRSIVELVPARTLVAPLTRTETRIHVTVSPEFVALLKKAKAGQSHVQPGATDEQVLTAALEALIEKQSKRRARVPPKVKREVVKRDGGKCTWPVASGGVCGSEVRLEIDHVVPRGKGGPDTVDNCRVLCRAHNLEAARRAYGDEVMDLFTQGRTVGRGSIAGEEVAEYGLARGASLRSNPIAPPSGGGVGCGPCSGRKPPPSARSGFASRCSSSSPRTSSNSMTTGRRWASRSAGAPGTTWGRCTWG